MNAAPERSRRPLLTSLLDSPRMCACILAAGAAHVALAATPLGGWRCPILAATGCPCPGCGLGRAVVLLLRGEFVASFRLHAFAPVLLAALLVLVAGILRSRAGDSVRAAVCRCEQRFPVAPVALGGLLLYWAVRFVLDPTGFRTLVM